MKQTVLTFITKVNPARASDLKDLLDGMGQDVENNTYLPFLRLKLLHFASLFLVEDPSYGTFLVFENNFDGALDNYLEDLYLQAAAGLHRIYSCCRDYPATSAADRARILSYLRAHVVQPGAYHIGNVGRSVERTQQEDSLREDIENFLDDLVHAGSAVEPPGSIRQKLQAFVQSRPTYAWAAKVQPRQTSMERFIPWLRIAIVAVIALVLLPVLIPLAIVWVAVLRGKEKSDPARSDFGPGEQQHVRELLEREDRTHIVQNHMASITLVKPGPFRQFTLRGMLWLANLVARVSTRGKLYGIPGIHFAHWSLIDNGRRLLFVSNFDGSWENYLDDFIDRASIGLTGIWSNTVGFPRTRFLVLDGARDGARFKAFARASQSYTSVWYSAYKRLTVPTVDNNSAIREDLFRPLDENAARTWLWRF